MFPNVLLCAHSLGFSRKKKKDAQLRRLEFEFDDLYSPFPFPFYGDPLRNQPRASLRSHYAARDGVFKAKKKAEMAGRVSNFTDLIQRVTASCLLHPLAAVRSDSGKNRDGYDEDLYDSEEGEEEEECVDADEENDGERRRDREGKEGWVRIERVVDMQTVMNQVFEAVSAMKKSYVNLQEAHCPWDPEKMRAADVAIVAELRRLGMLRERFRRSTLGNGYGGGRRRMDGGGMLKEVITPYEKAVEELKKEVKAREAEVENLKEKIRSMGSFGKDAENGKKSKSHSQSRRKVSCTVGQVASSPAPELFEATMSQVKEASKSFTSLLLSLMRAAHWDIAAAVRSIEAAAASANNTFTDTFPTASAVPSHHAKFALESFISRKIFQGFDHETFYMDGSLSALLNPEQFRRDCFTQYRDMKAMDPAELLGILPTCHFGKFCSKKYLAIVHPKMEESLFGDSEQNRQVLAGNHPRSQFYGQFLRVAKAIWLLHLLAFSLDPPPSLFEASRGAEFHPQYMESVVSFSGGWVPAGKIVGFPVGPGFKLGNGAVIKARVFLVPRS